MIVPEREVFDWGHWRWDVALARRLMNGRHPRGVFDRGDIKYLIEHYVGTDRTSIAARVGIEIDRVWAAHSANLKRPLVVIPFPGGGLLPIDGWHRLYRAFVEGADEARYHLLTPEQTERIHLRGALRGEEFPTGRFAKPPWGE